VLDVARAAAAQTTTAAQNRQQAGCGSGRRLAVRGLGHSSAGMRSCGQLRNVLLTWGFCTTTKARCRVCSCYMQVRVSGVVAAALYGATSMVDTQQAAGCIAHSCGASRAGSPVQVALRAAVLGVCVRLVAVAGSTAAGPPLGLAAVAGGLAAWVAPAGCGSNSSSSNGNEGRQLRMQRQQQS
jgi:hypothetical protein